MSQRLFHPGLEGLRGVAVAVVLLFHAGSSWLPGGFLGVSTFFTLSGFLITGLLVDEWTRTGAISMPRFWGRRLRRLLPASLVALVGIALGSVLFANLTQKERLTGDGLAALFYVSNWWLIETGADYDSLMGSPPVIQHFWSLSVEEQYYFFYPLLAFLILRFGRSSRRVFAGLLGLGVALSFGWMAWLETTGAATARIYYGTDTRAGELLAGGVLALVLAGRPAIPTAWAHRVATACGIAGLALSAVGWSVAGVDQTALYDGGLALYTLATLGIVAAATLPSGPVRALLAWPPLRWLGRISYGVYVYHWPIFLWVDNDFARILLTLLVADLSYRFLEEPIRAGRRVLGAWRLILPPAAIAAVATVLVVAGPRESAPPIEIAPATAQMDASPPRLRIAVVGDSLARDVANGLKLWGERSGLADIENLALPGCGLAQGAWPDTFSGKRSSCDAWPEMARARLGTFHPDVVVAVTAGWDLQARELPEWGGPKIIGNPLFDAWLIEQYASVHALVREAGARLVWITTPCLEDPLGRSDGVWDPRRLRRMNDHVLPAVAAGREESFSILDLENTICPNGQYARSIHGIENFRRDGVHFSGPAQLWVGNWIGEHLLPQPTAPETAEELLARTSTAPVDFATRILPIFERRCYDCHGQSKRKGGLSLTSRKEAFTPGDYGVEVLVPGDSDMSYLFERISTADAEERMPHEREPLRRSEIELIRRWIDEGADWPEDEGPRSHWAYRLPALPPVPPTKRATGRTTHPVDAFIDARLEQVGMTRSPRAPATTQIRRLYLDLIGLPPSPGQVAAFVADPSDGAYAAVVESLLQSRHFGERWAGPWLDLARYADSDGHQRDQMRSIWPYRDWVIDAINADMPFDQFTVEQLAGDLLPRSDFRKQLATGFHRCAKTNLEVGVDPEEDRSAQVIDRVNTTAATWLGLTFECAQCHDHKFDPLTQREYYSLFAFFNNTPIETARISDEGVALRAAGPALFIPDDQQFAARRKATIEQIAAEGARLQARVAQSRYDEWRQRVARAASRSVRWKVPVVTSFRSTSTARHAVREDGSVLISGRPTGEALHTLIVQTELARITAVRLEILPETGAPGSRATTPVLLSEFRLLRLPTGSAAADPERIPLWTALAEGEKTSGRPEVAAIDDAPGSDWSVAAGAASQAVFYTEEPVAVTGPIVVEFEHDNLLGGSVRHFRLSFTGDDIEALVLPLELQHYLKDGSRAGPAESALRQIHARGGSETMRRLPRLATMLARVAPATTPVMNELTEPRSSHLFNRGNFLTPGEAVSPDTPAFLHAFPDDAPRNRLGFARWLVDPANPLFARVAVNRWWAEIFGTGLVSTPEDFGIRGARPSHPELLDWLAVELGEHSWSRKHIVRLLVLSETYRQSSVVDPAQLAADPDNRLLARARRRRLPAELIRDNALAVSGLLSDRVGGPPVYPPQPPDLWRHDGAFGLRYRAVKGSDRFRRGIYVVRRRTSPYPSFTNFDAPDRNVCAVRRPETNTPLQALTLLNDEAYVEASLALAERVLREAPGQQDTERLAFAMRLVLAREATAEEFERLATLLAAERDRLSEDPRAASILLSAPEGWRPSGEHDPAELATWFFVANAILNLDETMNRT